jgi:hypothetical protein
LVRSTRLNPAELCRPQPKRCGFGHLRSPAGFTGRFHRQSAKIGGTGAWIRGAQMRDGSIFCAFHASQSGGALPPSAEALRIWAPAPTGRFHRKSAKIGGTGAWSRGAQMRGGSIYNSNAQQAVTIATQVTARTSRMSSRKKKLCTTVETQQSSFPCTLIRSSFPYFAH